MRLNGPTLICLTLEDFTFSRVNGRALVFNRLPRLSANVSTEGNHQFESRPNAPNLIILLCFNCQTILLVKGRALPWIPEPSTVNNKLKRREGSGSTGRFFD